MPLGIQLLKNLVYGRTAYNITSCYNGNILQPNVTKCVECNNSTTMTIDLALYNYATLGMLGAVLITMSRINAGHRIIFSMFKRGLFVRNSDKTRFIIPLFLLAIVIYGTIKVKLLQVSCGIIEH